jgi:SAM-dependent methyltransferase
MDPAYVAVHAEMDRHHWWFRGRLAVLREVLARVVTTRPARLLELGCGSGNVLEALAAFGEAVGMEHDPALIAVARAAGLDVRPGVLPDELVVPDGWADVVLLLDVLEHLDEEAATLATARRALRGSGRLVVTVPAYPWLWSSHDVVLGHRRRYQAPRLRRALEDGGFEVERMSHFNTLLFVPLLLVRSGKRLLGQQGHDLVYPPATLNALLAGCFALERHLVPRLALPFGASLLAVARRC